METHPNVKKFMELAEEAYKLGMNYSRFCTEIARKARRMNVDESLDVPSDVAIEIAERKLIALRGHATRKRKKGVENG